MKFGEVIEKYETENNGRVILLQSIIKIILLVITN